MITPRFSCSQTDASVIVKMYCPSIRASDVEIHVDDSTFIVHVNPYFLRLSFSHSLLEDDESSAQYDPSSGYLTVTLTKANPGEEFRDLDLLAKLLAPKPTKPAPVIEVLSSSNVSDEDEDELVTKAQSLSLEDQEILQAADNDWQISQSVPEAAPIQLGPSISYGFLDMYTGYFKNVVHTENEVNELGSDAEGCLPSQRRYRRKKHEEEKWDEEHYMADFADDEYVQELISWEDPFVLEDNDFQFTEEENAVMLNLPRKNYIASPSQTHDLYLALLSLLFAYAYESRTNQRDPTPESAWTLCNLTPIFSALDPPPYQERTTTVTTTTFSISEVQATLAQSYRRSLAFPLYRSFALAETCRRDIGDWLTKGKRMVFRCLLHVKHILDHHEVYYIYSKIWVDDFCVWVQAYASDDILNELGRLVKDTSMPKTIIGWDLEGLERATQVVEDRETDSDDDSSDASSA
ncbi:hypothetical protein ONZ45_g5294 [Pleurotus djamor]|nr:hypothetical protein ONZ45_g5294 [Pleurotus djamor]